MTRAGTGPLPDATPSDGACTSAPGVGPGRPGAPAVPGLGDRQALARNSRERRVPRRGAAGRELRPRQAVRRDRDASPCRFGGRGRSADQRAVRGALCALGAAGTVAPHGVRHRSPSDHLPAAGDAARPPSRLGLRDARFDRLLALSTESSAHGGREIVPHRALERLWIRSLWTGAPPGQEFDDAASSSTLNHPLDLLWGTRDDAYAHTHAFMYFTDFGYAARPLPRPRSEILGESAAVVARSLLLEDYDLTAEMLMAWPLTSAPWSPAAAFGFRVLAELEDKVGFLPAKHGTPEKFLRLEGGERTTYALAAAYHTVYVMGILCALALRPGNAPPAEITGPLVSARARRRAVGDDSRRRDAVATHIPSPAWRRTASVGTVPLGHGPAQQGTGQRLCRPGRVARAGGAARPCRIRRSARNRRNCCSGCPCAPTAPPSDAPGLDRRPRDAAPAAAVDARDLLAGLEHDLAENHPGLGRRLEAAAGRLVAGR